MGLLDLPTELLERILFHVADPAALRAASRTCKRLAALTAATSPLWPALLRSRVDLTRRPGRATGWETSFFCYWDDTYGEETDSVAFAPPLARVRGWTGGDVAAGGDGGGGSGGGSGPAAAAVAAAAAAAAADEGGNGADTDGRFLYIDNRRAAGGAPPAQPAADAGAADGSDADRAVKRPKTAAAATAAAAPADEDPRLLYAALVAATRAGVATADPDVCAAWDECDEVWASEADHAPPHVWVARVDAPGLPWPPPPSAVRAAPEATAAAAAVAKHVADAAIAPEALYKPVTSTAAAAAAAAAAAPSAAAADVIAAGVAWLTAVGAAAPVLPTVAAKGTAEDVRSGGIACASATSGGPGDATYMRVIGEPLATFLRDGDTVIGITTGPASADLQRRAAGMNDAVRRLLGDRPALVFTFGEEAMNPVGGVVAVAWSPTLIVGLLIELVRT